MNILRKIATLYSAAMVLIAGGLCAYAATAELLGDTDLELLKIQPDSLDVPNKCMDALDIRAIHPAFYGIDTCTYCEAPADFRDSNEDEALCAAHMEVLNVYRVQIRDGIPYRLSLWSE